MNSLHQQTQLLSNNTTWCNFFIIAVTHVPTSDASNTLILSSNPRLLLIVADDEELATVDSDSAADADFLKDSMCTMENYLSIDVVLPLEPFPS